MNIIKNKRTYDSYSTNKPMSEINVTPFVDVMLVIFLGENLIEIETLEAKLKAITAINSDSRIFIRADEKIAYGIIMKVMSVITNAGYNKVELITKQISEN